MRSNLELLLLTLVQDGLQTPYELKTRADLSLGSTVPALARLEADGLLKASAPEARGSRKYSTTVKGDKVLKNEWAAQLKSTTTDVESVLRIAYLAWRQGAPAKAATFLESSAVRLSGPATMAKAEAPRFGRRGGKVDYEAMRWLRSRIEARRSEAMKAELTAIAEKLRTPGRRKTSKKP